MSAITKNVHSRIVTDDDGRKIGRITTVNKGKHGGKDHWAYSERGVPLGVFKSMDRALERVVERWNRYVPQGW